MLTFSEFVRGYYKTKGTIALHEPNLGAADSESINAVLASGFVSSAGACIGEFETTLSRYAGVAGAVATVNGTAALHTGLILAGVQAGDYVITQAMTFVATSNVIAYQQAEPIFVDISPTTLGMSAESLSNYLDENAYVDNRHICRHKKNNRVIRACVPVHTFGHPCEIGKIADVCHKWKLALVEDAAAALGSYYREKHVGSFGRFSALSFNGNKIITTGGGGMLLCHSQEDCVDAKHLTSTAKVKEGNDWAHDRIGFNYRMPNLNAALGRSQFTKLSRYLAAKRDLAESYRDIFAATQYQFFNEPPQSRSNYWLNAIICPSAAARDNFLEHTNKKDIATRSAWVPMHRLPMFEKCPRDNLKHTEYCASRLVTLPSTPNIAYCSNNDGVVPIAHEGLA